ncbi:coproporphyrinogen-III oxidase family protein [Psychrilyobacter atlanticus]|uniref:coproporphyrinogen-III oxidase family protein n=1 Tax=Psychrilyobacter atlanticus TaxID=271091 RepID=UPI0004221BF9|nr:coproporphyrinogen-III oxidase family protein [Psychrilyobacter atlanticus]
MNPKMREALHNALGDEEYRKLEKTIEKKGMMALMGEVAKNPKLRKMMKTMMGAPKNKEKTMSPFEVRLKSHHNSSAILDDFFEKKSLDDDGFIEYLDGETRDIPKSIYVHTPYCDKICSFCNLNREQLKGSLDEYANYIADEFRKYGSTRYMKESEFEVIFFGGGTPTVYKPNQLEIILKSIEENVRLKDGYEFTFETTLHNLNKEKLDVMMKYGVNRLSVGIQSFSEVGREFYNRTYGKEEVIKRLEELKEYFNGEVCIDIIYNYPNQSKEDVVEDAKITRELGLGSSSYYSLMVHDGSVLSEDIEKGRVELSKSLEREKELANAFSDELMKTGEYYQLELTKIAKKGGDLYKYIKVRNAGGDTFPIGVGAGGNIGNVGVFRMAKNGSVYSVKTEEHRKFDMVSGLMQFPKVKKEALIDILSEKEMNIYGEKMKDYIALGYMNDEGENFSLTNEGIFWGNNISKDILSHLANTLYGNKRKV